MQIFVKNLVGNTLTLEVELSDTIQHLPSLIHHKDCVPMDQQCLIFAGKQLTDDLAVCDLHIRKEATLHLATRLVGGKGGTQHYRNTDPMLVELAKKFNQK